MKSWKDVMNAIPAYMHGEITYKELHEIAGTYMSPAIRKASRVHSTIHFYRQRGNAHKHPWLSKILCGMNRHDFEAESMTGKCVTLTCFYCGAKRKSYAYEQS